MTFLPRIIRPKAPPIKTQGIKTKVVPLISSSISWDGNGRWIEPFLGSAAVALNIAPQRAVLADTNKHLISLYKSIQTGLINGRSMREYLEKEGQNLSDSGESYYYKVRDRFNEKGSLFDFVFLNRSCFNGMMRFNRKGDFNVPFCRKPERFRPALITKIVNQVEWAFATMQGKDWVFLVQDWHQTIADAKSGDLIYCDPPYVGRHTDYYNGFNDKDSNELAKVLIKTRASFVLSSWLENKYRRNKFIDRWFSNYEQRTMSHFYHVGPKEYLRNEMIEVIILSSCAAANTHNEFQKTRLPLFETTELF